MEKKIEEVFFYPHVKKVRLAKGNSLVHHLACGDTGTSVT